MRLFLITAAFILAPVLAQAQMFCGDHTQMTSSLDRKYGEARRGSGLSGPGALFEVWTSGTTGTWTILVTTPNGLACVVASGTVWHEEAIAIVGKGT